jgi:small GTP-binding protein
VEHDMTLGVEMGSRKVKLQSGDLVKLEIWDTAGQESYLSITRSYYRGADGCLLVFDISSKLSFENLSMWLSEARQNSNNPNLVILMIGNKADLHKKRQVSTEEAREFAQANGLVFLELSATNHSEVEEAFVQTAEEISKKLVNLGKPKKAASNVLKLDAGPAPAGGRGGRGAGRGFGRGGRGQQFSTNPLAAFKKDLGGECCK